MSWGSYSTHSARPNSLVTNSLRRGFKGLGNRLGLRNSKKTAHNIAAEILVTPPQNAVLSLENMGRSFSHQCNIADVNSEDTASLSKSDSSQALDTSDVASSSSNEQIQIFSDSTREEASVVESNRVRVISLPRLKSLKDRISRLNEHRHQRKVVGQQNKEVRKRAITVGRRLLKRYGPLILDLGVDVARAGYGVYFKGKAGKIAPLSRLVMHAVTNDLNTTNQLLDAAQLGSVMNICFLTAAVTQQYRYIITGFLFLLIAQKVANCMYKFLEKVSCEYIASELNKRKAENQTSEPPRRSRKLKDIINAKAQSVCRLESLVTQLKGFTESKYALLAIFALAAILPIAPALKQYHNKIRQYSPHDFRLESRAAREEIR